MKIYRGTRAVLLSGVLVAVSVAVGGTIGAEARGPQKAGAAPANPARFVITRANLAKSASFKVTQTISPKGGSPLKREYRVEVKGNKARLDYEDQAIGAVRYVANEKGVFFYIPGNKTAMKQSLKGGVEGALNYAFAQASSQLERAKKVGTATVSGQPTVVYKDAATGAMVYLGTANGFRLPVKTVLNNQGGSTTMLVSDIKLNIPVADTRFALPTGTQIIESKDAPGGMPGVLPGAP
jgi:outer membrane lipoprotein-sorting protein